MEIIGRGELQAVAEYRWNKAYFTKSRQWWWLIFFFLWISATFAIDVTLGDVSFIILFAGPAYVVYFLMRRHKEIMRMTDIYEKGGDIAQNQ